MFLSLYLIHHFNIIHVIIHLYMYMYACIQNKLFYKNILVIHHLICFLHFLCIFIYHVYGIFQEDNPNLHLSNWLNHRNNIQFLFCYLSRLFCILMLCWFLYTFCTCTWCSNCLIVFVCSSVVYFGCSGVFCHVWWKDAAGAWYLLMYIYHVYM